MAFHVYPDPQTAPLNLAATTSGALTPIVQLTGVDNDSEPGAAATTLPNTMFVRLVMLGAPPAGSGHPSIFFKPDAGPETEIADSFPTIKDIPDGINPAGAADATRYTLSNNVYLFKVFMDTAPASWQIRIRNNDGVAREFTCVVASSLAESRQPWIDVLAPPSPPGLLPGELKFDALTSQTPPPKLTLPVVNKGTGPLNVTGAGFPAGFALTVPPAVPPNSNGSLEVTFSPPAAVGSTAPAPFLLASDDTTAQAAAPHNRKLTLTGTTRKLEVMLMLDTSGSMGYMPNGSATVPSPPESRWGRAKEAAKQFLDLLGTLGASQGRFGVGMFPDITSGVFPAPSPSAADFKAPVDISAGEVTSAKNALDAHTPQQHGGATPIGFGIGRGIGTTASGFGYFQGTADALAFNRRYLTLMSDGAHNSGPPNPPDFYGTGPMSFKGKKVKVLTVGYGDPAATAFEVDHTLLNTIAAESEGQFLDAGADDAGMAIKKQFRTAIVAGLSLDPTTDPGGILTSSGPEARRQVTITPYDTKVAFVVNWSTPDRNRVAFSLLTPTCELITPAVAQADPHVFHSGQQTYALYTVDHDYLRNAANPGTARYGTWTLIVAGNGLAGPAREPFDYEVITESRLKLGLHTDRTRYFAGDAIKLTAFLALDGEGIRNAAVTLSVDAPGQSSANWLALNPVSAAEFSAAAQAVDKKDATALGIKTLALQRKGFVFTPVTAAFSIPMTDPGNQGTYAATVPGTTVPGTYDLYVTAVGQTEDGVAFRREKRLSLRVEVRPEPGFTLVDIRYRRVLDPQPVFVAEVRVWPRDRFGNVVLVDPAIDPRVVLTVEKGEFTGPLVGNLDGSYSRAIRYSPAASPSVGLVVDGRRVVAARALVPVARLRYVDEVVAFKLGGEARTGANQHREPAALLGDPTGKKEAYLSLGAFGAVTVGLKGQYILGRGDDDVTVFVQPDADLREYLVEALPAAGREKWVPVGRSAGVTQSFSLAKASVKAARAIRITDLSGRGRESNLKPSRSPGASIAGVGVAYASQAGRGKPAPRANKTSPPKKTTRRRTTRRS